MQFVLVIYHGTFPLPGTPESELISEEERKAVYTDYATLNKMENMTPGPAGSAGERDDRPRGERLDRHHRGAVPWRQGCGWRILCGRGRGPRCRGRHCIPCTTGATGWRSRGAAIRHVLVIWGSIASPTRKTARSVMPTPSRTRRSIAGHDGQLWFSVAACYIRRVRGFTSMSPGDGMV